MQSDPGLFTIDVATRTMEIRKMKDEPRLGEMKIQFPPDFGRNECIATAMVLAHSIQDILVACSRQMPDSFNAMPVIRDEILDSLIGPDGIGVTHPDQDRIRKLAHDLIFAMWPTFVPPITPGS